MNLTCDRPLSHATAEHELAVIVEALTARLQAGEVIAAEQLAEEYPEHAERLQQLLPALNLLAHSAAGNDGPGTFPPVNGATHHFASEPLGDFQIVRELGRGGMGVVYEARQLSLNRRVALKVLPFAATMDPKHLQRFRNEAMAAASLRHENIVHVYGVGCERSVHFYAMEMIDGQTLAQIILGLHHQPKRSDVTSDYQPASAAAPTAPVGALSTEFNGIKGRELHRLAARLIADAADALEHAHSLGIVHRDIKPGNLMVDAAGKIYVTDFGLARFGPDAGLTMSGDLLGTLRYMSPEQAMARHGLVDHRTDVYSLGATLYELLTGRPAVVGEDKQEVLRHIAFEEPIPVRKIDRAIPVELETITQKCLAKEPGERYATAKDLVEDLRRWGEEKAIKAKPPGIYQITGKWLRRHKALVWSASASAVFIAIVAICGLVIANLYITSERDKKELALQSAQKSLARLNNNNAILGSIFAGLEFGEGEKGDKPLRAVIGERLESAAAKLERDDYGEPGNVAALQQTLGAALARLGYPQKAIPILAKAHAAGLAEFGADHEFAVAAANERALAHYALRQFDQSISLLQNTVPICIATKGLNHSDTLKLINNLASSYEASGRLPESLALKQSVLNHAIEALGSSHSQTLIFTNNLATGYWSNGQLEKSIPLFEELVRRSSETLGDAHLDTLRAKANLGVNYRDAGRNGEAIPLLEVASQAIDQHNALRWVRAQLIDAYGRAGQIEKATVLANQSLKEARASLPAGSPELASVLANTGNSLLRVKAWESAEEAFRNALLIREKLHPNDWRTAATRSLLGRALLGLQRYSEAEPYLLKGCADMEKWEQSIPPASKVHLIDGMKAIVDLFEATGQSDRAAEFQKKLDDRVSATRPPKDVRQ